MRSLNDKTPFVRLSHQQILWLPTLVLCPYTLFNTLNRILVTFTYPRKVFFFSFFRLKKAPLDVFF